MHDLIIIGASAAGSAAAIYAARRNLDFLILSRDTGGEVASSGEIKNYPGFVETTGIDLSTKFTEHVQSYNVSPSTPLEVTKVEKKDNVFTVLAKEGEEEKTYQAKTVIMATGVHPMELKVPGEKEFYQKGLSYCTVCDGPLFKNKAVAVIGGANSATEAAIMLSTIAEKIYLLTINSELWGESVLIKKVESLPNIEVITKAFTKKIYGENFVQGLEYELGPKKEKKTLKIQGIFVHIGVIPNSNMVDCSKNEFKEIITSKLGETSVPGLFAAGDVTDTPYKQIAIATGQGATAALSAVYYINRLK